MPEVHIGREVFPCVSLCVDRHSGYIVAVPARKRGLTAKEVAVMMVCHWLTVFSVLTLALHQQLQLWSGTKALDSK